MHLFSAFLSPVALVEDQKIVASPLFLKMRDLKGSLNRPIKKNLAATIILVVAAILPAYGLYNIDWNNVEFGVLSVLLPVLYVVFVTGLVFVALGKKGRNLTSVETDRKIAITYSNIQKKLTPIWWLLGSVWLVWVIYLVWELR